MPAMMPVPQDHPLMIAWNKYKGTEDFANSMKWATAFEYGPGRPIEDDQRTANAEGSLWAAFMEGFRSKETPVDVNHGTFCEQWRTRHLTQCAECIGVLQYFRDLSEENEKLIAEIAAAGEGWIPCAERLPKRGWGEYVDVVIAEIVQDSPAYLDTGEDGVDRWYWVDPDADPAPFDKVSHWRKRPIFTLPAPAKPAEGPAAKEGK